MTSTPPYPTANVSATVNLTPQKRHIVRTLFASLFGIIALLLILTSILVIWLNRTLTNTSTYVSTVAPLATNPAIQNYITEKVTDQLIQSSPLQSLETSLLTPLQITGQQQAQIDSQLQPLISNSVRQVISSPKFAAIWRTTNQNTHQQLIQQLNSGARQLTLNFHPLIISVINQLNTTKLASVSIYITGNSVSANVGIITFKGGGIVKFHRFYTIFKEGTIAIVVVTIIMATLCVVISVHHLKTLRRIVTGTGIIALLIALSLRLPSFIVGKSNTSDQLQQKAVMAILSTLLHNLELACLIIAIACFVIAIGSKVFAFTHKRVPNVAVHTSL
jgi:hypothetical protein